MVFSRTYKLNSVGWEESRAVVMNLELIYMDWTAVEYFKVVSQN
jgi:hypothetical protein